LNKTKAHNRHYNLIVVRRDEEKHCTNKGRKVEDMGEIEIENE
jgi:hypothetical protein